MSAPRFNAYITIFNHFPSNLAPGSNFNPPGTILWPNSAIPSEGVFSSGWGANSGSTGVNGTATWKVTIDGVVVDITIIAQVREGFDHYVAVTASEGRVVDVSVGEYEPKEYPLKVDINLRRHVTLRDD